MSMSWQFGNVYQPVYVPPVFVWDVNPDSAMYLEVDEAFLARDDPRLYGIVWAVGAKGDRGHALGCVDGCVFA